MHGLYSITYMCSWCCFAGYDAELRTDIRQNCAGKCAGEARLALVE